MAERLAPRIGMLEPQLHSRAHHRLHVVVGNTVTRCRIGVAGRWAMRLADVDVIEAEQMTDFVHMGALHVLLPALVVAFWTRLVSLLS